MKIFKEVSFLAVFSFLFSICTSLIFVLDEAFNLFGPSYHDFVCRTVSNVAGLAALLGIAALIHTRKARLKGKWFAILAIILGAFGFMMTCL